jgi:hypothetical protein
MAADTPSYGELRTAPLAFVSQAKRRDLPTPSLHSTRQSTIVPDTTQGIPTMATIVPDGTPFPDADRRFHEARWPLLELVGWTGKRHRGGYGTDGREATIALELVFGPRDARSGGPRLAVGVGTSRVIDLTSEGAPHLCRMRLAASWDEVRRRTELPLPVRDQAAIDIEGAPTRFDLLRREDRWLGQGRWDGLWVLLHATGIEPPQVHLARATTLPGPFHGPPHESVG